MGSGSCWNCEEEFLLDQKFSVFFLAVASKNAGDVDEELPSPVYDEVSISYCRNGLQSKFNFF